LTDCLDVQIEDTKEEAKELLGAALRSGLRNRKGLSGTNKKGTDRCPIYLERVKETEHRTQPID
jgi:hypothetical protein